MGRDKVPSGEVHERKQQKLLPNLLIIFICTRLSPLPYSLCLLGRRPPHFICHLISLHIIPSPHPATPFAQRMGSSGSHHDASWNQSGRQKGSTPSPHRLPSLPSPPSTFPPAQISPSLLLNHPGQGGWGGVSGTALHPDQYP